MSPTDLKRRLTNTNTDKLCVNKSNVFSRLLSQLSLNNGTYILDPVEKTALNTAGLIFTVLVCLYAAIFVRGFIDGLSISSTTAASTTSLYEAAAAASEEVLSTPSSSFET